MNARIVAAFGLAFLAGCSGTPQKPQVPALTPETANQLLHYEAKAQTWMEHVKKQNPSCTYVLDIPDQTNQPAQLDLRHIVQCGGRPAPIDLDASVSFEYDRDGQHWTIKRFSD